MFERKNVCVCGCGDEGGNERNREEARKERVEMEEDESCVDPRQRPVFDEYVSSGEGRDESFMHSTNMLFVVHLYLRDRDFIKLQHIRETE